MIVSVPITARAMTTEPAPIRTLGDRKADGCTMGGNVKPKPDNFSATRCRSVLSPSATTAEVMPCPCRFGNTSSPPRMGSPSRCDESGWGSTKPITENLTRVRIVSRITLACAPAPTRTKSCVLMRSAVLGRVWADRKANPNPSNGLAFQLLACDDTHGLTVSIKCEILHGKLFRGLVIGDPTVNLTASEV